MLAFLTGASCSNTHPEPSEVGVVVHKEIVGVQVPVYRALFADLVSDCKAVSDGFNSEAFTLLA